MPNELVDKVIRAADTFYKTLQNDPNGRYRSWEYCYKRFHDAREDLNPDYDMLCLNLAFYLASWGMYRGSSFLLQKDYKVHLPVVQELLKNDYNQLFGIECFRIKEREIQKLITRLYTLISNYYETIRASVKSLDIKSELSGTLITKILMGTLGCVPAYDRYFINGIKNLEVSTGSFSITSLKKLADFYELNSQKLEVARKRLLVNDLDYPQMKLLDMGFWQIGLELEVATNQIKNRILKQKRLMHIFREQFAKRPSVFTLPENVEQYRTQCLRSKEFDPVKKHFDYELLSNTYNGVETCVITIPFRIGFANYAFIAPDFDLNGEIINTIDSTGMMHRLAVTVFPENNKSFILLSCLSFEMYIYRAFFEQIKTSQLEKVLYYFNRFLPLLSENLVLSKELWQSLNENGQFALIHMTNLLGDDYFKLSQVFGMELRNAAKNKYADYSKRGTVDLFQALYEQ